MHRLNATKTLACTLMALALAACGGGAEPEADASLFDADGQPSAAARIRPEGSPPTRAGLYATTAQYKWEALTVEPYTVLVDVDAADSPAEALARALADHARTIDPRGLAHFVRGGSHGQAAAVADALSASGVAPVFLVVDARGSAR